MMMTMTYNRRQGLSIFLVLSMIFTMWISVCPVNRAEAGILSAVGGIAKSLFVNAGALAGGALTAVVGAAVGGGPLGMAVGGVAGFFATKKALNWTTKSFANFATVAGAVAGGFLCAGMGFPMLAVGVLGGGLVSRLLVKGVGALVSKITGGKSVSVSNVDIDEEAAKRESAAVEEYLNRMQREEESASVVNKPVLSITSQDAYNRYVSAFQRYSDCAQKGDAQGAQAAMKEYQENMELYQNLLAAGL